MMLTAVLYALLVAMPSQQHVIARLFAATPEGPYISYSWGEHWNRLRGDMRGFEGEIRAFACLGPVVYAGGTDGLFVSEDFGETYRRVDSWRGGGTIVRFLAARLYALEPTLFVGTTEGLFRTIDGGEEWTRVGERVLGSTIAEMNWPGPELFVVTDGGLFLSVDKGDHWTRLGKDLPASPLSGLAVSRFFGLDPKLFVGTEGQGLYRSVDGGKTFQPVGASTLGSARVSALFWWGSLLLVGTDDGLFLSSDGGTRFLKSKELDGLAVHTILVPGADADVASDVIVGTNRGVFKSSDGTATFRRVQEGMGELEVLSLATFPMPAQDRERRSR